MSALLEIVLIKAALAALLAVFVRAIAPVLRRPALAHALWLVVLLELLSPPVLRPGLLPPVPAVETAASAAPASAFVAGSVVHRAIARPVTPGAVADPSVGLGPLVLCIWLLGAGLVLVLSLVRIVRFRRLVSAARDAPAPLVARALELSRSMGLTRCPRVRLVSARISPMLWGCPGAVQILLPESLLGELSEREIEALIAHELAHYRRRDHWVRLVELGAQSMFWWHPAVFLARAHLRRLEEICCDALVVATLPGRARDYARGLVRTMEFLAAAPRSPALASGFTGSPRWKERLTMILENSVPASPSRWQKVPLAAVAAAALLVLPTWAEPEVAGDPRPVEERDEAPSVANEEARERLADLDHQARQLMARLEWVRAERARVAESLSFRDVHDAAAHELDTARRQLEVIRELEGQRAEERAQLERSLADAARAERDDPTHAGDARREAAEQEAARSLDSEAAVKLELERKAARVELAEREKELRRLQLELEKLRAERESAR